MDIAYIKKIQEWVEHDNKVLKFKEDMKDSIDKKKELEEEILTYVEDNKYDKLTLNISDGNIKFSKRNTTQPLSMKTLKTIFERYNDDGGSLDISSLMKYISDSLETKQKIHMTRDFNVKT
jgi:mannose-6-phosphate isomerase class I